MDFVLLLQECIPISSHTSASAALLSSRRHAGMQPCTWAPGATHLHAAAVKGGRAVDAGEAAGAALVAVLGHLGLHGSRAGDATLRGQLLSECARRPELGASIARRPQTRTLNRLATKNKLLNAAHLLDCVATVCSRGTTRAGTVAAFQQLATIQQRAPRTASHRIPRKLPAHPPSQ